MTVQIILSIGHDCVLMKNIIANNVYLFQNIP